MTRTFALAALAGLLLGGTALGAPSLKTDITVVSEIVTVGDMFEDAGLLAERALFRAPAPGTTGIVSLAAIRDATARAGLTDYRAEGIERVRVTRDAVVIDTPRLETLIAGELAQRGLVPEGVSVVLRFDDGAPSFTAEAVADPARLLTLTYVPGSTRFAARLTIAGMVQPVELRGSVALMVEVPHLARSVPAGQVIVPGDLELRPVALQYAEQNGIDGISDLVGKALVRNGREGLMVRRADVTDPVLVTRNTPVTVIYRSGALKLTMKGQALTSASVGQPVQVMNMASRKILNGVANAAGVVEVDATMNMAGL